MYHVVDLGDSLRMFSKKRGGTKELNSSQHMVAIMNLVHVVTVTHCACSVRKGKGSHSMTFLNPALASWLPPRMHNMKRGGTEREIQNCINLPGLQILQL